MAFSEKYTDAASGSNLNGGSDAGSASFTFTSGTWVAATGVFSAAGADLSTVTVGQDASVFIDGASVGVFCGRVTAKDDVLDTITVSLTAKSGTPPTDGTGNRSIRVGGAWEGPNGAEAFPFGFVQSTQTNASADPVRVNMKGGTNYAVTANSTHNIAGPVRFQGYTTTVGDGGKATIDGTIVGASYSLLTLGASATNTDLEDIIFANNGTTNAVAGVTISSPDVVLRRVVSHDMRGSGFSVAATAIQMIECEAYATNAANSANLGGFVFSANGCTAVRCIAHDNTGSNTVGFRVAASCTLVGCIADTNGKFGIEVSVSTGASLLGCVGYNNVSSGIAVSAATASSIYIENSILTKNGSGGTGYGIDMSGAVRDGAIVNCAFGAGTQANATGQINNLSGVFEQGTITLATDLDPFSAASTGNFNVTAATVKGTGRGTFTETQASYTGTVSYPDVGAAQHQESAGSGGLMRNPSLSGGTV